jgi:hypothetical protein
MIIAVTFGFDEKFAIRALMRHPPSDRTRVVVLLPEGSNRGLPRIGPDPR